MEPLKSFADALYHYDVIWLRSRNLAARTRSEYTHDLEDLFAFLTERCKLTRPDQVERQHLEHYLAHLDGQGFAGATRKRRLAAIRSLFGFLADGKNLPTNPAARLRTPDREYHPPRVLREDEYKRLLEVVRYEPRDQAIIELLLQTGLRLSELAGLRLKDVDVPKRLLRDGEVGSVRIFGKGRLERIVTLNFKAAKALKAYLAVRPKVLDERLFVSKFRAGLGTRAIQRVVEKHIKEAGIERASVHALRHTFATHHVKKGTNLRVVQEALGHASLATTGIYVHLARELMDQQLQVNAL